jgi:hypothetical protein
MDRVTRVERIDEKLSKIEKPDLIPIDNLHLEGRDVLIVCAGFEDRAIRVLEYALASGNRKPKVVIVEYKPYVKENKIEEMKTLCEESGIQPEILVYDRENPPGAGDQLLQHISDIEGRILIDTSGMSRLLIVQLIVSLGKRPTSLSGVEVLYSEAAEYPPTKEKVEKELKEQSNAFELPVFLSSGVFGVTIVPELSSVALHGRPTRLVAFPSFSIEQLTALRSELQPSKYTFIHGVPPLDENKWRLDAIKNLNRTMMRYPREDYDARDLPAIYERHPDSLSNPYGFHPTKEVHKRCTAGI